MRVSNFLPFCLFLLSVSVSALFTDIYRVLDSYPCVRLLNNHAPIGCTTPEGGIVGDLRVIRTSSELNNFNSLLDSDTAIVISSSLFNKDTVEALRKSSKVKGVLVLYDPPSSAGWSPDDPNPNAAWGLKMQNPSFEWNPIGDSLNFEEIPFPVYALSEEESQNILALNTNDTSFPRHAVQFLTFMYASQNAETCLRRSQCIPLGGKSVWSTFFELDQQKPLVLAMANMDSTAVFHDLATGADSTASGIVGLLGAALALQNVSKENFVNDIMFSFWAGESWGYLGSKKFTTDVQSFQCEDYDAASGICTRPFKPDLTFEKIKLDNVIAAIELNQIGLTGSPPSLYVHEQTSQSGGSLTDLLVSVAQASHLPISLTAASSVPSRGLPPSSMQTFIAAHSKLSGVVITDHEDDYVNKNFHSHMDTLDFNPISNSSICDTATILARTLYLLATNQNSSAVEIESIHAPCDQVSALVYCLASNFSCDYLNQFISPGRAPVPTYYTGVFGWSIQQQLASPVSVFLSNFLAYVTAYNSTPSCEDCGNLPQQFCILNQCLTAETHYHDAISPGFDWDYSNNVWKIVNSSEPMWVESNWNSIGVQLFLRDNPTSEALFLTFGVVEFVVCLIGVFYAKRYFLRNYKVL